MCKSKSKKSSTTLGVQVEVMFELLRSAVFERDPFLNPSVRVDWDFLMDLSSSQGILAWIYDGICKLPIGQQPSRQKRINWALSAQEIWHSHAKQKEVLSYITNRCHENNIRLLLLKGIGLSLLYPKPESRPSGDIDIYLYGDYDKGNLLFSESEIIEGSKHSEFVCQGVVVENHRTVINISSKKMRRINDYLSNSTATTCRSLLGCCEFTPLSNLLFLVVHASNHLRYDELSALSIRSVLDISYLIYKYPNELSPSVCKKLMSSFGLTLPFELFLRLGEWILGIDMKEYFGREVSKRDLKRAKNFLINGVHRNVNRVDFLGVVRFLDACVLQHQRRWRFKFLPDSSIRRIESLSLWNRIISHCRTHFSNIKMRKNRMVN